MANKKKTRTQQHSNNNSEYGYLSAKRNRVIKIVAWVGVLAMVGTTAIAIGMTGF